MKKIFLICCLLAIMSGAQATKRALVMGVGDYPQESGWAKINGDKDVPVVEAMLLANGFKKQDIVELVNAQATAAAIRHEMDVLIGKAQAGDVVYIHFSGHGQRVTDMDGDEEDGYDEAWIPYDACFAYAEGTYEGQNHIIDDQINGWLTQLRQKVGSAGKITVVADACHSGGGSRATEQDTTWVMRGSSDVFALPGEATPYTGVEEAPVAWTFISACKSYQCNYEYRGTGSLTYALSIQSDQLTRIPCTDVQRSIRTTISTVIPFTQTPVVDSHDKQQSLF